MCAWGRRGKSGDEKRVYVGMLIRIRILILILSDGKSEVFWGG